MRKIICNTKFKLDPFADGGSKRSVQLRGILADYGFEFEDDPFDYRRNVPKVRLIKSAFRAVGFIRKHYPRKKIHSLSEFIRLVKYYALRMTSVYDKYLHRDVVFLWENTNDRDMLYLMKATGNRVIVAPHNIESLVTKGSLSSLGKEVDYLKACDVTFAISTEETWLLRLLGANAYYLPYYPPKVVEEFFVNIRQKRETRIHNEEKCFLLLGSATNIPTRDGMQSMIDYFDGTSIPFDLIVAGYGTESLMKPNNPRISFYGSVSKDKLELLLCKIDAVLVYQPPTTGALTRIPEMRIAGIPVFVNFDASRNYFNIENVRLYNTFGDLLDRLLSFEDYQVNSFVLDKQNVNSFINIIKELVNE